MAIAMDCLGAFLCIAVAAHLLSLAIVFMRRLGRDWRDAPGALPAVSLVRPVCGVENHIHETLASSFALDYPRYEIVFCAATADDAVNHVVERLMARHPAISARLLLGNDGISANPKLNNLAKGWRAAQHDWILMSDSNVLLPPDFVQRLLSRWTPETGLVSSPPVGMQPQGLWAELECAFLNTHQARWQLAADQIGIGFAQGKTLLWRRDLLDGAGGIQALAAEAAEDAAATKIVRAAGLKVRLARMPFAQPIGERDFTAVWQRQLRWARLRRATFPAFFIPELVTGGLFPLAAAVLIASALEYSLVWVLALFLIWYGAELALARVAGWPSSAQSIAAILLRDVMLPALWLGAWAGSGFVWRGHIMDANADVPSGHVAGRRS